MDAALLFGQNNPEESLKKVMELKKIMPDLPSADQFLSVLYMELDRYDVAEQIIQQLYNQDPYDLGYINNMAFLYAVINKNLDEALRLALYLVDENPDELIFLDTLAWVYTRMGEYAKAQEVFNEIEPQLEDVPAIGLHESIYGHLGYFYAKIGDREKSQKYFSKGLSKPYSGRYINKLYNEVNVE